jgi:hypothetical protein
MMRSILAAFSCFVLADIETYASCSVVHVIGDSHSREFEGIKNCSIHHIGPVTMHRVGRDGFRILDFRSLGVKDRDCVVLCFGEIDVRCHIGKQRDFEHRSLDEVLDTLLENYFFSIFLNRSFYQDLNIIVYSVTPPSDRAFNLKYPYYGNIQDRVMISKKMNEKLISMAQSFDIHMIDVYDDYADENGILVPSLSDGNVHIGPLYRDPIQNQLDRLLADR